MRHAAGRGWFHDKEAVTVIERSRDGEIAILRLARPPVNALDAEMLGDLADALDEVERSDAQAAVLTGTNGAFSAGADLIRILDEGREYIDRARPHADRGFERMFTFLRPIVAAVNGHAIAGGCVLVCACDHRVAARGDYRIGLAELRVGVPFPSWALETMRFALAPPHLQRLITSARLCTPEGALAVGFVDEIVEPDVLMDRAIATARRLATIPAATFALTKRALREPFAERARRGGRLDDEGAAVWASDEARNAIRRFLERTLGAR